MIRVGGRPRTAQKKGIELQFFFIFFENWKLFGIVFCDFQLNDIRVKIKSKSLKNLFFWIELPISVKTGKVDYPTQKPHAPWMWLQICILKICWLTFIFTEKGRVGDIQMNRSLSSYGPAICNPIKNNFNVKMLPYYFSLKSCKLRYVSEKNRVL